MPLLANYCRKNTSRSRGEHGPENNCSCDQTNSESELGISSNPNNTHNNNNHNHSHIHSHSHETSKIKYDGVGLMKTFLGPSLEDAFLKTLEFGKTLMQKCDENEVQENACPKSRRSGKEKIKNHMEKCLEHGVKTRPCGVKNYPESRSGRKRIVFTAQLEKNMPLIRKPPRKLSHVSKIRSLDSDLKTTPHSPEKIKKQLEALIQINKDEPPESPRLGNWDILSKIPRVPVEMTVMPSVCIYRNDVDLNSSSCEGQSPGRSTCDQSSSARNERRPRTRLGAPSGICQAPEFISNALGPTLDISIIDNLKMMRNIFKTGESGRGEGNFPPPALPEPSKPASGLSVIESEMSKQTKFQEPSSTLPPPESSKLSIDRSPSKVPSDKSYLKVHSEKSPTKLLIDRNPSVAPSYREPSKVPSEKSSLRQPSDRELSKMSSIREPVRVPSNREPARVPSERSHIKQPHAETIQKQRCDPKLQEAEKMEEMVEDLQQKYFLLQKEIEMEEKERAFRRIAFEEEERKMFEMKSCLENLAKQMNESSMQKSQFDICHDSKYEAIKQRVALEEEKLSRLKDQYECCKRELSVAKTRVDAIQRNKCILDAWDVIASRVCHTRLPSFTRAHTLERKQSTVSPGSVHCCFPSPPPCEEESDTPRISNIKKSRSQNNSVVFAPNCEDIVRGDSFTNIKACLMAQGEIPYPIQRDITCGLHQTLRNCTCKTGSGGTGDCLNYSSDDELMKKRVQQESRPATRSKSDTTVKRDRNSKIIKVLWAVTRINIFQDNCRTYEVMDASSTPPSKLPAKTEGIFVVRNSQRRGCQKSGSRKRCILNFPPK